MREPTTVIELSPDWAPLELVGATGSPWESVQTPSGSVQGCVSGPVGMGV
jgi:hypothetical protein